MDERSRTLMTSSHCLVVLRQDLWADNSIISSEATRNVCVYQKRGTITKELNRSHTHINIGLKMVKTEAMGSKLIT